MISGFGVEGGLSSVSDGAQPGQSTQKHRMVPSGPQHFSTGL